MDAPPFRTDSERALIERTEHEVRARQAFHRVYGGSAGALRDDATGFERLVAWAAEAGLAIEPLQTDVLAVAGFAPGGKRLETAPPPPRYG